jgi:hypothetical protein
LPTSSGLYERFGSNLVGRTRSAGGAPTYAYRVDVLHAVNVAEARTASRATGV